MSEEVNNNKKWSLYPHTMRHKSTHYVSQAARVPQASASSQTFSSALG